MQETPAFGPPAALDSLREVLDRFVAQADRAALVRADPVELVHAFDSPHDREVVGLLVACLAYGRVASIKNKSRQVLESLGAHPAAAVDGGQCEHRLSGFVYRFQKDEDLPRFLAAVRKVRSDFGSLGAAFLAGVGPTSGPYCDAMAAFMGRLRAAVPGPMTHGLNFLLPDPRRGGASKRLCLYLRWMIRAEDGMDLGVWRQLAPGVDAARLVVPLDTHIARISQYVGLTQRKSPDMKCALEITDRLAALSPEDPLVYDMALCHLGISGQCARRRDVKKCEGCGIRAICGLGPIPRGWA